VMNGLISARKMAGLSMLVLAALLVLSAALAAPDAEAKKRKKINTVQCVVGQTCFGTSGRDRLLGTDSNDALIGR
jgi:hypothetical protein